MDDKYQSFIDSVSSSSSETATMDVPTSEPDKYQEFIDSVSSKNTGKDKYQDFIDSVPKPSETPETDKAVTSLSREAQRPKVDWNHPTVQGVMDIVKGIPGMAKQVAELGYQGVKFQAGGPQQQAEIIKNVLSQGQQQGTQLAKDVQSPVGSREWTRGWLQLGLMASPGLELAKELQPVSHIRGTPLEPEMPIERPPSQRPGTTAADVSRAMERRFTMVEPPPEPTDELSPAPPIEQTLSQMGQPLPFNPEAGPSFRPDFRMPIQTETARIGEENASRITSTESVPQREVRTPVGEKTPLRQQGTPAGAQEQEPVSTGESVAAEVPQEPNAPQSLTATLPEGGPSIRAVAERPIEAPEPGTILGWEEATAHGDNWLNRGGNINKVVDDFRKSGKVNELEMGKMNAYLQRLQSVTNQAGDALRKSPNDPKLQQAYQAAVGAEQTFTEAYKPMHTVASGSLAALQGHVPLTNEAAASFTGLRRRFQEFQGKPMSAQEVMKAERISKQAEKTNGDYAKANGEVYKQLDNEYGRIRTTRKSPPTLKDLGEIFKPETLDEVCDV